MNIRWNGGTRSNARPYGDGSKQSENEGNRQVKQLARVVSALIEHKVPFTVENPVDSVLWHTSELQHILSLENVDSVVLDQCMYYLRPPDWSIDWQTDSRVRKRTRLVGSVHGLASLKRMCDCGHQHVEALGHVKIGGKRVSRSKAAGAYPVALCKSLAKLFARHIFGAA